jgi:hypothetical protein
MQSHRLVECVQSQLLNTDSHKPGQDTPKRAHVSPPFSPPGRGSPAPQPQVKRILAKEPRRSVNDRE